MLKKILLLSSLCLTLGYCTNAAVKLSAQSQSGVTVSPAELQIEVSAASPQQRKTVSISNNYDVPLTMQAELRAIDEASGLLVPAGELDENTARAISISETNFTILPRTKKDIIVQATNNESLTPGGHYATLLLTQRSSERQQLSLRSAIGVNIFFIKRDGAKQSISLESLQASNWLFHISRSTVVTLKNDGNIRVTPHGVATIETSDGDIIAKGIINQGSQPVMPGKTQSNTVGLTPLKKIYTPQRLTFRVTYRADDLQAAERSYQFWYIPAYIPISILGLFGLIIILFLVRRRLRRAKPKKAVANLPAKVASPTKKRRNITVVNRDNVENVIAVNRKK